MSAFENLAEPFDARRLLRQHVPHLSRQVLCRCELLKIRNLSSLSPKTKESARGKPFFKKQNDSSHAGMIPCRPTPYQPWPGLCPRKIALSQSRGCLSPAAFRQMWRLWLLVGIFIFRFVRLDHERHDRKDDNCQDDEKEIFAHLRNVAKEVSGRYEQPYPDHGA